MKKNRALWRRTGAIAAFGVAVAIWRYEAATAAEAAFEREGLWLRAMESVDP